MPEVTALPSSVDSPGATMERARVLDPPPTSRLQLDPHFALFFKKTGVCNLVLLRGCFVLFLRLSMLHVFLAVLLFFGGSASLVWIVLMLCGSVYPLK